MNSSKIEFKKRHWIDAWHVNPSANRDYDFIDGLRGAAILMVIVCHHFYVNPKSGAAVLYAGHLISMGGRGVTLFFALSGFLISWPFWKRKVASAAQVVPPGYFQRRFWKIYPPLALSILVLTPVYVLTQGDWSYAELGAKWLAGLPFIIPVSGKFNPVMWTLVVEVQFYITLPLIFFCLKPASAKVCLGVITLLFLLLPVSIRAVTHQTATFAPDINSHFPAALDVFYLGILIAGLDNLGLIKKNWTRLAVMGVVLWPLVLLVAAWFALHPEEKTYLVDEILDGAIKISAGGLLCLVANPQHLIARLLCAPWLRWCGIISYEWYLLHQPLALWSRIFWGSAEGNVFKYTAIVVIPLLSSMTLAALVYRFFSLPILKYGRSKS